MTLARPGSGTAAGIGWPMLSAFSMPTATAIGAPACPEPPTVARNAWVFSFQAIAAAYSGVGTAAGEAASRTPSPGSTRPVPNRLSMLSAQATALPSLSSVAKLVEAGSGGRPPPASDVEASRACASAPPCRHRAATASARAVGGATRGWIALQHGERRGSRQTAIGRRRQERHLVVAVGQHDGGAMRGSAPLRSASASGPPASGEACSIWRASTRYRGRRRRRP